MMRQGLHISLILTVMGSLFVVASSASSQGLQAQNKALFERLKEVHALPDATVEKVRSIFESSGFVGQGNPAVTKHPMTREQCHAKLKEAGVQHERSDFTKICGAKYMAPLYDPKSQKPEDAQACIDQFEYPNIPCEYPVVWVRAKAAAEICEAMGKRLCDAHEWEGACAGAVAEPDYHFSEIKGLSPSAAQKKQRALHNAIHDRKKIWAYGSEYKKGVCAANSQKDSQCNGGNWKMCGSNTYPGGAFPECASELKVYDLHGNAAEHMNLPLSEDQMASRGSVSLGVTEMKGSWFIWDKFKAHEDACRWRAPYWHGSRVRDSHSHENYHLGFRCCKTLP